MAYKMKKVNGQTFRDTTKVYQTGDIAGLDELLRDLADYAENVMPDLETTSAIAANVVLQRAKEKAPVAGHWIKQTTSDGQATLIPPGTIKNSLKVVPPKTKKGVYIAISRVTFGKEAAYAIPVELGHRHMAHGKYTENNVKEQPFMRPAADESKDEFVDIMIRKLNELLERELGE